MDLVNGTGRVERGGCDRRDWRELRLFKRGGTSCFLRKDANPMGKGKTIAITIRRKGTKEKPARCRANLLTKENCLWSRKKSS